MFMSEISFILFQSFLTLHSNLIQENWNNEMDLVWKVLVIYWWIFQKHQLITTHLFSNNDHGNHPYFSYQNNSRFWYMLNVLHHLCDHISKRDKNAFYQVTYFQKIFQNCQCIHKDKHLFFNNSKCLEPHSWLKYLKSSSDTF